MPRCWDWGSPAIRKRPSAIDQLPLWLNRLAAFAIILGLVGYVVWVWTQPRSGRPRALDAWCCRAAR